MGDEGVDSSIPFDSKVNCNRSGWVNSRRRRNPRFVEIGGGDGDVGCKPTVPLHRRRRAAKRARCYFRCGGSSPFDIELPSTASSPLPKVAENDVWRYRKPDISKRGNLIPRPQYFPPPPCVTPVATHICFEMLMRGPTDRVEESSSSLGVDSSLSVEDSPSVEDSLSTEYSLVEDSLSTEYSLVEDSLSTF